MNLENWKFGHGAELDEDELGGVSGGVQGPSPLQPPVQPTPSRPSIPPDPGRPGAATPKPKLAVEP